MKTSIWQKANRYLDWYWDNMTMFEQVTFVYAMGMFLLFGILLLGFVISNGMI